MMKTAFLALIACLLGSLSSLQAQTPPANPPSKNPNGPVDIPQKNRFWQANVGGGEYMVALDRISAISRHKYVLDGSLIVDEVTVDALGQALVRFYYIEPITEGMTGNAAGNAAARIVDRARGVIENKADAAGTDIHNMVVKKFPETTHAKEIEYRVMSAAELSGLYASVRTAWETGHGRKFAIK